jgi:hypothetical protein
VLPRPRVVGDAGEQATQLDGGRQVALLLKDGTDRSGLGFGDNEHGGSLESMPLLSELNFRNGRAANPTAKGQG